MGDFVRIKSENKTFSKNSTGRYSNKIYRIKEIQGVGMFLEGYNKKVFPADVKKVNEKDNKENIAEIREKNLKKNKVKRILNKELN